MHGPQTLCIWERTYSFANCFQTYCLALVQNHQFCIVEIRQEQRRLFRKDMSIQEIEKGNRSNLEVSKGSALSGIDNRITRPYKWLMGSSL